MPIFQCSLKNRWTHTPTAAETAWTGTLAGITLPAGCAALVRFAVAHGRIPGQLTDADLEAFVALKIQNGRHPKSARRVVASFRGLIAQCLEKKFPLVSPPRTGYIFGIPADAMPEPLKSEQRALVTFKTQPGRRLPRIARPDSATRRSKGRRREIRIRPSSANALSSAVSRLFGFAVLELGVDPQAPIGLLDLVTEETVDKYIDWQLDVRLTSGANFNGLRMLHAALHDFPAYRSNDFNWFTELLATIPDEDEEAVIDRKSQKYIPWAALCAIPGKIAAEKELAIRGTREFAKLAHDQLFMTWMITFVHRQANVRACTYGSLANGANLFRGPVDLCRNQTLPAFVVAEIARNPSAEFFQLHYSREEAKGKQAIWSFVPEHIIHQLEDYLNHQCPLLVSETSKATLFQNREGNPLTAESLEDLWGGLCQRYAGRWTTPHLVRDAYAHAWLDEHPEDYMTVCRALWHRSVRHTELRYGRKYDAARALEKTSAWLANRLAH